MKGTRYEQMKQIRDELVDLKTSPLYKYRQENHYFPVVGEGDHQAKIMFIGEAPGENEAKTARPFCGAAGRVLDELIVSIGLERKDVYITNVVKDRPPNNRDPLPEEIELYAPFLVRQVNIIQPKIVATLGRFSMEFIMRKFGLGLELESISKMHGKVFSAETEFGGMKIVPLYHPAVALYKNSMKKILMEDAQILKSLAV